MRPMMEWFTAAGAPVVPVASVVTLSNATTYYVELTEPMHRSGASIHWAYNAALVATITIEASNRPTNETSSYAASGWATTGATAVSPAASAGETLAHYADMMSGRMRAKVVVTTGGTLRGDEHSKE